MVLKKKSIIILTLIVLIVAAGYLSTKYGKAIKTNDENNEIGDLLETGGQKTDDETSGDKVAEAYFIDVKLGRENSRAAQKQEYTEIINNENASEKAKAEAEEKLLKLIEYSEVEMQLESLIESKGFEEAVVFLSDDSANVTVKADEISPDKVDIIKNIVCRESEIPASQVMVQAKQ